MAREGPGDQGLELRMGGRAGLVWHRQVDLAAVPAKNLEKGPGPEGPERAADPDRGFARLLSESLKVRIEHRGAFRIV